MSKRTYYIYITTNKKKGTLYIGVTNNLERRMYEHKNKILKGFTEKYNLNKLIYYEETDDISIAIHREKRLKHWNRSWKIALVEKENPNWEDLSKDWSCSF